MTQVPPVRCFECGATYPASLRTCPTDGAPLCPETIGSNWKVEGVLAPSLGGGVFAAFHVKTLVRAAIHYFPPASVQDAPTHDCIERQLGALRLLDKNRGILPLIEDAITADGARYVVAELGTLRLLQDLLDEWQQQDRGLLSPPLAAQLMRPILSTLSTAHRIGIAHQGLTPLDIYLISEGDPVEGITRVLEARIHGLQTFPIGPELRQAVAADLRAVGGLLFELIAGNRPPDSVEAVRALPLPTLMNSPVGKVAMRALGAADQPAYLGAEEMLRALVTTVPTLVASAPTEAEISGRVSALSARARQAMDNANNKPTVPIEILQPPKEALPTMMFSQEPAAKTPVRSGLTAELNEVSLSDLVKEREQQAGNTETLARSVQHRPSALDLPPVPSPPHDVLADVAGSSGQNPQVVVRPEGVFQEIAFGVEPTIPAVMNASEIPAAAGAGRADTGSSSRSGRDASPPSVSVSISGSMPKPLAASGSLVIPPQPSGPILIPPLKTSSVSAGGGHHASLPARPVSRPPIAPTSGAALDFEPTPNAGQPAIDPEGTTEQAAAIAASTIDQSPENAAPAKVVPQGKEIPPWVWAGVLAVVCILSLLAGLFGR